MNFNRMNNESKTYTSLHLSGGNNAVFFVGVKMWGKYDKLEGSSRWQWLDTDILEEEAPRVNPTHAFKFPDPKLVSL